MAELTASNRNRPNRGGALPPDVRAAEKERWSTWVKELRRLLGWTQGQLADAIGLKGPAAVCRWETGGRHATIPSGPAQTLLLRLAEEKGLVEYSRPGDADRLAPGG